MSSAWTLGQVVVLGLGEESQTARNLVDRPDAVINVPGPSLWEAVEPLAPLTGLSPVPADKPTHRHEPAKFEAADFHGGSANGRTPQQATGIRGQASGVLSSAFASSPGVS